MAPTRFLREYGMQYGVAVISVALIVHVRSFLEPHLVGRGPFLLFVLPVLLSGWYGGLWHGLFATVLGGLASLYYYVPPVDSILVSHPGDIIHVLLFVLIGSLISMVCESMLRARERAQNSSQSFEIASQELRALMNVAPIPLFVAHDVQAQRITGNAAGDALLRQNPHENLSLTAPAEERSTVHRLFKDGKEIPGTDLPIQACAKSGKPVPAADYEMVFDDGEVRHIYGGVEPLLDGNGQSRGAIAAFIDVTDRRQAEEAVHRSESRFRRLTESSSIGLIIGNDSGALTYANDAILDMLGYTRDDYYAGAVTWAEMTPPELWERDENALMELRINGVATPYEKVCLAKDGRRIPFLVGATVLERSPTGIILAAVLTDLTPLREAESALRESEARLRRLMEANIIGIVTADEEKGIIDANDAFLSLTGHTREEMEAGLINWQALTPPEFLPLDFHAVEEVRRLGRCAPYEKEYLLKDGRRMPFVMAAARLHQKPLQYIAFTLDISERKQMEELLRQQAEALQQSDRAKDDFLALLGHELRNPLAAISNALAMLEDRGPARREPEIRAREVMGRQVQNMARLVNDLLDVSRINLGKIDLKCEPMNLVTAVHDAASAVQPLMDECRHEFHCNVPSEPVWLNGDPTRIEQVIGNLLNNAAKYTEPGGRVEISLEATDETAILRVRDTGIGLSPEMLPVIFSMYAQTDQGLSRARGGIGVGLTLVRQLVDLHDGTIEAESDGLGKGSEFTVRLPVIRHVPLPPEPDESVRPLISAAPRRILVVDDNIDAAETLSDVLEQWGHTVQTAPDGPAALEAVRCHPFDVVILDINLPGMDGCEVARRLRQEFDGIPMLLVAMTGFGQASDQQRTRDAGIEHHLTKPVDMDLLRLVLQQSAVANGIA